MPGKQVQGFGFLISGSKIDADDVFAVADNHVSHNRSPSPAKKGETSFASLMKRKAKRGRTDSSLEAFNPDLNPTEDDLQDLTSSADEGEDV